MNFYKEEIENILKKLKTTELGLTTSDAKERIARYGKNELPKKKSDGIIKIFLRQLKDPIVLILIITIIFSFLVGEVLDAFAVIFIVLIDFNLLTIKPPLPNQKKIYL